MNQNWMRMSANDDHFALSSLELDCLKLAANGFRVNEIASEMNISAREVENQFYEAERKLGAKNRLHAIGIAVSQGLIGIESKA